MVDHIARCNFGGPSVARWEKAYVGALDFFHSKFEGGCRLIQLCDKANHAIGAEFGCVDAT
jgi:hypothetical protein